MKILHVGPIQAVRGATGPSHSIRGLAAAQAEIGLEVGLLSSLPLPAGEKMEGTLGVQVLGSPNKKHYNPWFISQDWISHIQARFGVPDLVNFHDTYRPFQLALAHRCRQLGWPYIFTARGGLTYLAQGAKRTKKSIGNCLFFRSHVKHAVAVHALTIGEAEQIEAQFEVQKIIIAPNGVEDYLLEAAQKLSPADLGDFRHEGDLILGFVGRIDVYHKGLDFLLKAMAILKLQPDGSQYKLFVVGPFRTKKDEKFVLSEMRALGLQNDVKILGPKDGEEKLRYFLACDVFVHTSRFEGMPMAVLEAMALGRPCLVTPGTNMADVVCEGGGWKCQPNPKSIAEAIKFIYEKRDFLRELGRQSYQLVQARFTWRKVAEQLKQEYAKICNVTA